VALGAAKLADTDDVWGKHRVSVWDLTGDATYAAGGYAVTAAQFGLRQIYGMKHIGGNTAGAGFMVQYNTGTGKVQFFNPTNTTPAVGPATEATTNQASVNSATVRMLVVGE
jgi:hypothetical protein